LRYLVKANHRAVVLRMGDFYLMAAGGPRWLLRALDIALTKRGI
jgi:hypothetical protein